MRHSVEVTVDILSYGQGERKPNITTRVCLGLCYDLVVEMSYITPNVYSKSPVQFTHYELAGIIPGFVTAETGRRSGTTEGRCNGVSGAPLTVSTNTGRIN
jgi:hypothetical protein